VNAVEAWREWAKDNMVDKIPRDEQRRLHDVIDCKAVAEQIRDSAVCVLRVALAREGIAATEDHVQRLAREIGNNSATTVAFMEIK